LTACATTATKGKRKTRKKRKRKRLGKRQHGGELKAAGKLHKGAERLRKRRCTRRALRSSGLEFAGMMPYVGFLFRFDWFS
jgi:hypothetical protein